MIFKAGSPAGIAEQFIIESIWNHRFAAGSVLPAERELAELIGVTRTTLREVLQRLARDGWLTIQHGRPTLVNNIWETAGLNLLEVVLALEPQQCPQIINQLLSARTNLSAVYMRGALRKAALESGAILYDIPKVGTAAEVFTVFDYRAHHELARLSGNIIYVLILNGLQNIYRSIGLYYFSDHRAQELACQFYKTLAQLAQNESYDQVYTLCRNYGQETAIIWQQLQRKMPTNWPQMLIENLYQHPG